MIHDQKESECTNSYHLSSSGCKIDKDGLHMHSSSSSSSSSSFCTVLQHFEHKKGSCAQIAAGIHGVEVRRLNQA